MHLLPADRAHRRVLDEHTVCEALAGVGDLQHVREWADRFAVLADRARLTLLLCIHRAPGICVTDLAVAADMTDSAVSQALRLLRAGGLVRDERDGRVVRYHLVDEDLHTLLHLAQPAAAPSVRRPSDPAPEDAPPAS